jgi:hypothetical protein
MKIQEGPGVGLIYVSHVIYSQLQSSATSQVYVVFCLHFVIFCGIFLLPLAAETLYKFYLVDAG